MSAFAFNALQYSPFGDRNPLPKGKYRVVIDGSEIKDTQTQGNRMVSLSCQVLEASVQIEPGQKLFVNINHQHSNPAAQLMGLQKLSALCRVCGVPQLQDTQQLHGRPFRVDVTVDAEGKYNDITAYYDDAGTPVAKMAQYAGQAAPAPAAMAAPQGFAQPPQGFAPQPAFAAPAQGFAPPQGFAQPAPQAGFVPPAAPQQAPGGFAAPVAAGAPGGWPAQAAAFPAAAPAPAAAPQPAPAAQGFAPPAQVGPPGMTPPWGAPPPAQA